MGQVDLEFKGEMLANVTSQDELPRDSCDDQFHTQANPRPLNPSGPREYFYCETCGEEWKDRWTEIRIYRTDSDKYVVERVGKTFVAGEFDRHNVFICTTPADILRVLQRRNLEGNTYYTYLTLDALEEAGKHDKAIAELTVERI